jgi:hypothetical protein
MKSIIKKGRAVVFTQILIITCASNCSSPKTTSLDDDRIPETSSSNSTTPSSSTIPSSTVTKIDPWTDAVIKTELIVYGTFTNNRYEVTTIIHSDNRTGTFAYTISTLTIEKVIKGDPSIKEVYLKAPGGIIEEPGRTTIQDSPGPSIGTKIMLGLNKKDGFYYPVSSDPFWIETSSEPKIMSYQPLNYEIGRIIKIMPDNNIPITLPHSEWPPIPAATTRPKQ